MKKLLKLMLSITPLPAKFKADLKKRTVVVTLPRNHFLIEVGKVSEQAYFLNSGMAMSYRFIKGEKHIEEFYNNGKILLSPKSFFDQLPSLETVQLLQESNVVHISYTHVMELFSLYPTTQVVYRVTMNRYYEESRSRIHDFQYLTATERYEKMHHQYPLLQQLVPQEFIASYLGIAPQSLSRIKREQSDY